jgi:hypothetical protein
MARKAVNEKDRKPLIVPNNFQKLELSFFEEVSASGNESEVDRRIQRAYPLRA